jgi:hypothetical protein
MRRRQEMLIEDKELLDFGKVSIYYIQISCSHPSPIQLAVRPHVRFKVHLMVIFNGYGFEDLFRQTQNAIATSANRQVIASLHHFEYFCVLILDANSGEGKWVNLILVLGIFHVQNHKIVICHWKSSYITNSL